jgi:hypothetical protein
MKLGQSDTNDTEPFCDDLDLFYYIYYYCEQL